jgi:hypothetical protein
MKRSMFSRAVVITLSAALAFNNVNLSAFAEDYEPEPEKTITKINQLDEETAHQILYVGAVEEDITFPDTLEVTVTYQEEKETKVKIESTEEEPSEDLTDPAADDEDENGNGSENSEDLEEEGADPEGGDDATEDADNPGDPDAEGNPGSEGTEGGEGDGNDDQGDGGAAPDTGTGDDGNSGGEDGGDDVDAPAEGDGSDQGGDNIQEPAVEPTEGTDVSLLDMVFPAIRAYAASDEPEPEEPEMPISSEETPDPEDEQPEQTAKAPGSDIDGDPQDPEEEDEYETVIETVTITEEITLEDIAWELDKENSSFDRFSSEEAGTEFIYVPVISDVYKVETELPTITVSIEEEPIEWEYKVLEKDGVRVEGNLPVGATLEVSDISDDEARELLGDDESIVLFALDICIMLDGEEIMLDDSVKVTITPPEYLDTQVFEDEQFEFIHVTDDSNEVIDTQVNNQGELEFEADSFSPHIAALTGTGAYEAEFAEGRSFSQAVKVNFSNAALITGNVSYVKLKLWGNITGSAVKLDDNEITNEPFVVFESDEVYLTTIIEDEEGNSSSYVNYTFSNIPVYVQKGTGHNSTGGDSTYKIPEGFYGIQIDTVEGYSPAKASYGSDTYYVPTPVRDINDPVWTTSTITIENSMLDLVNPTFSVNWQDNRNYADMRPFTDGTSIDEHLNEIKSTIGLYYKSGGTYVSVADDPSVLVSSDSAVPQIVGGPFSWGVTYRKLPKFMAENTPYDWYIGITDSFYDGKKSYYQLSGLNEDGYLRITEENNDAITLTFTNTVKGNIIWRVGDAQATAIPALPDGTLYSDAHTTMKLYKKAGRDDAELVNSSEYSIAWTESQDRQTWEYSITGLPLYASDGDAILYYTVMVSDSAASYKYTYDNGVDSTETDKCLPGQKIYATSIGDAVFSFDKVWYDDNDTDSINRRKQAITKGITFYLWRYPSNLTIADGAPVTYNAKQFSYKLVATDGDSNFDMDLSDFATAMGVPDVHFPKFDEQGFAYRYYVTEVSNSELYKTVYWNSDGEFTGTSSQKAVENGGSICNVRSGQIAPEVTKQWNVAAVSDYVGSACTFKLQRKENSAWVDVDGAEITLSGFSSSKKKVTGVFPTQELYDLFGVEYEYRVIESAVRAGSGEMAEFTRDWEDSGSGECSSLYTMKDYSYKAVSTYVTSVEGGAESAKATVVNKLYGTKKLTITKSWVGRAWNIGTEDALTGNIEIDLKRALDGGASSLYAKVYLDKPSESNATVGVLRVDYVDSEQADYTGTYQINGGTWKTEDIEVLAYTEEGQQYLYSITEQSVDTTAEFGKEYDRSVSGKRISLSVSNRIGSTTYKTRIDINKIWKDDSDTSQRSNITVELGSYGPDGTFVPAVDHETGEPYKLVLGPSRDYDWYIWVDGNDFKPAGSSETATEAIANHLSIRVTDAHGRTIEQPTFDDLGESNKTITGGVVRAIVEDDLYRPGYKVVVSRNNASGTSFTITNTRVASRSFAFTKNWGDSSNALGLRGDFLRVALFREVNDSEEEVAFIDIPTENSTNQVTVNFTNGGSYYPAYDTNGNNYIYSIKEYICEGTPQTGEIQCVGGAEPDDVEKTEVNVSATKDTTTTGYVVERSDVETEYLPISGVNDLGADVRSLLIKESYGYTNRAAGQRSEVEFYVVWHDNAKSDERPDIYLTLYYDGGEGGAIVPFTGSYTERWEDVEAGNKFIQRAVFSGLPAADDEGRVYNYYVSETFNNTTTTYNTQHYTEPLMNAAGDDYNLSVVTRKPIGPINQLVVKDGVNQSTYEYQGHVLTKESSFTLTSISDTVKIEGRKLWLGIPDGIDVEHLPGAYIYLFRESVNDATHALPTVDVHATQEEKMDAYAQACVDPREGEGGSAPGQAKYVLLNSTKSMYVFGTYNADGTVNTYTEFPKYDDLGYMYKYAVREVIYNFNENELPADVMYPEYSDNTTDLSNQYKLDENANRRDLVVKKQWYIQKSSFQDQEAKATFRLYRRELRSDGDGYHALLYAEDDSSLADPASSASAAALFNLSDPELEFLGERTITSGETEITWENYQIFAPSGKLYGYYIIEITGDMPGYIVSLNGADSTYTGSEGSGPASGNTPISGGTMEAGDKFIGVAYANNGISLQQNGDENAKVETFRNTYDPEGFSKITFTKKWVAKDGNGDTWTEMIPTVSDRQEPLTFSVYCIAKMQSSIKDNYDRIDFAPSDYTVSKTVSPTDPTVWNYTITFKDNMVVPIYSANGNLYTYYVSETLNSDFVKANYQRDVSYTYQAASAASGLDTLAMGRSLQNSLKGSFSVQKIWDDFSNDYGMREGGITFDVYYRLGDSGEFTKYNNTSYTLNSSNKWARTISALPVTSNDVGDEQPQYINYQYRIVETGIIESGSNSITVSAPADGDQQSTKWIQNKTQVQDPGNYFAPVTAGNYQVYNPADLTSISSSQTRKLVNQLDTSRAVVNLKVTKNWQDDGDVYSLRPTSITVTIQSSIDGGANWTDVVTRSLTESSDAVDYITWEKTFENLPKYFGTGDNDTYLYRAVESKVGSATVTILSSSGDTVTGTGGAYEFTNVTAGDAENGFTTDITNTIRIMDKSINVLKRWNMDMPGSEVAASLFSANYTTGEAGSGTPVELDKTPVAVLNQSTGWEYTYTGLPKYNMDGKPIRYYVKELTTGDFKTQYLSADGAFPSGTATDDLQYVSSETAADFYVVIVNTPLTSLEGTKIWDDSDNLYGIRPERLVLTLQRREYGSTTDWTTVSFDELKKTNASPTGVTKAADGSAVVTLNAANSWHATVDKLALFSLSDGLSYTKYQYRLAELALPNGYTRDTTKEISALTYDDGYIYDGTEMQQESAVINFLVTRGDITVRKIWNTTSNAEKHDVSVRLLAGNRVSGADTGTLTLVPGGSVTISGSGWTHVFEGLPAVNTTGNEIVYYIEEVEAESFDTAYYVQSGASTFNKVDKALAKTSGTDDFEFRIVNTPLTSITGSKIWSDDTNGFGLRPQQITLTLQRRVAGGAWEDVTLQELQKTNSTADVQATISEAENWTATIDKLPEYELSDGLSPVKFTYRMAEIADINAYSRRATDDGTPITADEGYSYGTGANGQTSAVTNYLVLRENPVTVNKIWNTDLDKSNVTVSLLSRNFTEGTDLPSADLEVVKKGTTEYVRTISAADNWTTVFEGLPLKNMDGQYIVYYVAETSDDGFSTEYYVDNGTGLHKVTGAEQVKSAAENSLLTQIVNTPYTTASVEKEWVDDSDKFATRPDSITVKLQRKTTEEEEWADVSGYTSIVLNEANNWSETVEDLDMYVEYTGAEPVRYEYRFREVTVPASYEVTYEDTFEAGVYKTTVTNTLITKEITVVKQWKDNSDSHGIRPATLTFYVEGLEYDGEPCSNVNLGVTPVKSNGNNTWTYVFEGLPKYAYGEGASSDNPVELMYTVTEDVTTPSYPGGFILENYYVTAYEVSADGNTTTVTNTVMDNDGTILVEKEIYAGEYVTTYAFPFKVSFRRPDNSDVPYTGAYYLYSSSEDADTIRQDAYVEDSAMSRIKLSTSDGTIRVPAGKVAVLTGINSMYQYTVTESPNHAGYDVYDITVTGGSASKGTAEDTQYGGTYGYASGQVPGASDPTVKVKFTNRLLDMDANSYLKIENTTAQVTTSGGETLTGGHVKIYHSGTAVIDPAEVDVDNYDYVNTETPYIRQALSVEYEPDTQHGYRYSNTLTIYWWEAGEDFTQAPLHSVTISGYLYTDSSRNVVPYTGSLTKDNGGNISVDSEFSQFLGVWSPLLDGTPFKSVTVLQGSVVITLATSAMDMPPKTLVSVSFVPPAKPAPSEGDPAPDGSDGSNDNNNEKKNSTEETTVAPTAEAADADKLKDQIGRDGQTEGVRTGDETPITLLLMLFTFFAICFAIVYGKYRRMKPKKK